MTIGRFLPAVSVVVPVFNAAGSVLAAVSSVLDSTIARLEVICVDDGSTDDSARILQALAAGDSRVTVLRLDSNRGVSIARNQALEIATGEYVSFLDADDLVPPGALDLLLEVAGAASSDMVIGKVLYLEDKESPTQLTREGGGRGFVVTNLRESRWLQSVSGHHCGNLYRRQLLESHRIRFEADLGLGEDQVFQATAMVHAASIALIEDTVYLYHHYSASSATMKAPSRKSLLDDMEWRRRAAQLFREHGLHEAGAGFLNDWSYSIINYWLKIPGALAEEEARGFFSSLRSMMTELGIDPHNPATPPHHRHLLDLVMSGEYRSAFSFLMTDEARFGFSVRGPSA